MEQSQWVDRLRENVRTVRETIAAACRRVGREPESVCLVAVTKYVDLDVIRALLELGERDLGENRVQQFVQRAGELGTSSEAVFDPGAEPPADAQLPRWHMIGHLQRNKVKALLPCTRTLHSLDSLRLADEIEKRAEALDTAVDALVEVNVAAEDSKQGVAPAEVEGLVTAVAGRPRICLRGLMTMAPYNPDPEAARPIFAELRELLETLRAKGTAPPTFEQLSMGMTQDYVVAVEEGATLVRVGSALYEGLGD